VIAQVGKQTVGTPYPSERTETSKFPIQALVGIRFRMSLFMMYMQFLKSGDLQFSTRSETKGSNPNIAAEGTSNRKIGYSLLRLGNAPEIELKTTDFQSRHLWGLELEATDYKWDISSEKRRFVKLHTRRQAPLGKPRPAVSVKDVLRPLRPRTTESVQARDRQIERGARR
jgi:hypothetical protein